MAISLHVVSDELALVVVERESYSRIERKIGRDVILIDVDLAVLNILRMNELDLVDHVELTKEHRTYKSVKVTSCNKSFFIHFHIPSLLSFHRKDHASTP